MKTLRLNPESAPDTSYTSTVAAIADGSVDAFRLVRVQGVATLHTLWYFNTTGLMVYVEGPEGGPSPWFEQWFEVERDLPAWKPPADGRTSEQAMYDASAYVLNQAFRQVAAEMDMAVKTR